MKAFPYMLLFFLFCFSCCAIGKRKNKWGQSSKWFFYLQQIISNKGFMQKKKKRISILKLWWFSLWILHFCYSLHFSTKKCGALVQHNVKIMTAKTRKTISFASSFFFCLLPASLFSFLNVIPPCTYLFTYICTHHRLDENVNENAIITFFFLRLGCLSYYCASFFMEILWFHFSLELNSSPFYTCTIFSFIYGF